MPSNVPRASPAIFARVERSNLSGCVKVTSTPIIGPPIDWVSNSCWHEGRAPVSPLLGVVARAVPVDDDSRLVPDDPAVVAARQRGDVARSRDELGAVVHADRNPAAHVVLEVRRVAAVRARDRLDVVRPAPAGLENVSADLAAADVEDLRAAVGEFTDLVGIL